MTYTELKKDGIHIETIDWGITGDEQLWYHPPTNTMYIHQTHLNLARYTGKTWTGPVSHSGMVISIFDTDNPRNTEIRYYSLDDIASIRRAQFGPYSKEAYNRIVELVAEAQKDIPPVYHVNSSWREEGYSNERDFYGRSIITAYTKHSDCYVIAKDADEACDMVRKNVECMTDISPSSWFPTWHDADWYEITVSASPVDNILRQVSTAI